MFSAFKSRWVALGVGALVLLAFVFLEVYVAVLATVLMILAIGCITALGALLDSDK